MKKKNILTEETLDSLNIIHQLNTNLLNEVDKVPVDTTNLNKLIDDTVNVNVKKKRGRKKKIIDNNVLNVVNNVKFNNENIKTTTIEQISTPKSNRKKSFSISSTEKDIKNTKVYKIGSKNKINDKKDSDSEDNNNIFKELLNKQRKNICLSKKLLFGDIKRISKFLSESIFDENKCSLWNGYITNEKNQSKGTYINFYFNKKKIALHRLLYINYIGEISNDEYIKFSCENKGKCCNIHHMKKYSYNKNLEEISKSKEKKNENEQSIHIKSNTNSNSKFIVEF